jgi:uncharacterized protein (UPF0332 family)
MIEKNKQEIISYRIKKAQETFQEVQLLIDNRLWTTAVNRLYYACYYAVSALLIKHDIKTQTHNGTRQMFGLHFIKTERIPKDLGKLYSDLFDMRHSGDYEDFVDYSQEDILAVLSPAKDLIFRIEQLVK